MSSLLRFIRTHPKKLVFFVGCTFYSGDYVINKYRNAVTRRSISHSVMNENYKTVNPTDQLRRISVFINPFARRGKILKEFELNVAPILHLSGLDVQMIYLDTDFELKELTGAFEYLTTDGILIVGDDNLFQNALTGLLRRDDFKSSILWSLPIGLVPLGTWNDFINSIYKKESSPNWYFTALKPILDESSKRHNVLEIRIIPDSSVKDDNNNQDITTQANLKEVSARPVFAISGIEWNIWRDIEHGQGKKSSDGQKKPSETNEHRGLLFPVSIWSPRSWTRNFGSICRSSWFWFTSSSLPFPSTTKIDEKRNFFTSSDSSLNEISSTGRKFRTKSAHLVYTPACAGCSKCWSNKSQDRSRPSLTELKRQTSAFSRLFGFSTRKSDHKMSSVKLSSETENPALVTNPECMEEKVIELQGSSGVVIALDGNHIRVDLMRGSTGLWDHITQFLKWLSSRSYARSIADDSTKMITESLFCDSLRLYPDYIDNEFYWIDNDYFEASPIEVRVRYDAINLFTS